MDCEATPSSNLYFEGILKAKLVSAKKKWSFPDIVVASDAASLLRYSAGRRLRSACIEVAFPCLAYSEHSRCTEFQIPVNGQHPCQRVKD